MRRVSKSAPITTFREMAEEAERLAAAAAPLDRAKYLTLARQWTELADETEQARKALEGARDILG